MELKSALAVCLISLFSATLVVLIARSLDSQAATRLEPHLVRIVEELEAIRSSGGISLSTGSASSSESHRDGLMVYYFHSNTRCTTCRSIESQSHEAVLAEFAEQLDRGEVVWKTLNYEEPAVSELATQFDVQMPVVVLVRMKDGQIAGWNRLDNVWGLVDDEPGFARYIGDEIRGMLDDPAADPSMAQAGEVPAIPIPGDSASESRGQSGLPEVPIPE